MRISMRIGAAVVAVIIGSGAAAAATPKGLVCYNSKTGAQRIVTSTVCPKGFTKRKPVAIRRERGVSVSKVWVKALDGAMPMHGVYMTAAFMHITNISDRDVTLIGGAAPWARTVQVHEVLNGVMQQKQGGLVIRAGYTIALAAGGNHLMFMGMSKQVLAGDEVTFTLRFADGGQLTATAPVKLSNAGSEAYQPIASM